MFDIGDKSYVDLSFNSVCLFFDDISTFVGYLIPKPTL